MRNTPKTLIPWPWLAASTLFALGIAMAGCAGMSLLAHPPADIYRARCAQCHELKDPAGYTPSELRAAVATYGPDAGIHAADEQAHLANWLVTQTALTD